VLAENFNSLDALSGASLDDLTKIHEIGDVVAGDIVEFFVRKESKEVIEKLKKAGVNMKRLKKKAAKNILNGKVFVFTGEMQKYSRGEAGNIVKSIGGRVSSTVGKTVDYVVVGAEPGSKYDKAVKLGIKIVDEKEFLKMIEI